MAASSPRISQWSIVSWIQRLTLSPLTHRSALHLSGSFPTGDYSGITLATDVAVCSSTRYSVTFWARQINSALQCTLKPFLGTTEATGAVATGFSTGFVKYGPFFVTPNFCQRSPQNPEAPVQNSNGTYNTAFALKAACAMPSPGSYTEVQIEIDNVEVLVA
ncbi:hypothetical protein MMC24_007692 [Lignoscripta atroalba]|nr:hypothetical protein [Lignoscripta atroalba]